MRSASLSVLLLPVFAFAVALVVGCSRPSPPTLSPERVTVTRIDPQGIGLQLEMTAVNPNVRDLSVSAVSSRIVIDKTHEVGRVTVPGEILLPAGRATMLEVPVSIGWSDIGLLAQLAATGGAVPYSVDGTIAMGGLLGPLGVPFHLEGAISHNQLVQAAINSMGRLPH